MLGKTHQQFQLQGRTGDLPGTLITGDRADKLAILFPGAYYSFEMPLFYYSLQLLLAQGYQLYLNQKLYAQDQTWCDIKNDDEAYAQAFEDVELVVNEAQERADAPLDLLMGKSLGTYLMTHILESDIAGPSKIIWLTPSLRDRWECLKKYQDLSLVVIGDMDPRFEEARPYLNDSDLVLEGADHSLDNPVSIKKSLDYLDNYMTALEGKVLKH